MIDPRKPERLNRAVIVGGGLLVLCAAFVGYAYLSTVDVPDDPIGQARFAASPLAAILARCEEEPTEDTVDGRPRFRCVRRTHPAFMIVIIGTDDDIDSAKMLVPMGGAMNKLLDRMALGMDMFGAVAGVPADTFLPQEYKAAIGTSEASVEFEGRVYTTQPIAGLGLIFSVTPVEVDQR